MSAQTSLAQAHSWPRWLRCPSLPDRAVKSSRQSRLSARRRPPAEPPYISSRVLTSKNSCRFCPTKDTSHLFVNWKKGRVSYFESSKRLLTIRIDRPQKCFPPFAAWRTLRWPSLGQPARTLRESPGYQAAFASRPPARLHPSAEP